MPSVSTIDISEESLVQIAELHMAAFHGYPNTRIGLGYVVALIRWFCEAKDAIALCAIDEQGRHLGYVVGAPLGYSSRMHKALIWRAARGILAQPWLALDHRFRRALASRIRNLFVQQLSAVPELPLPTFSLVSIGIMPSSTRSGVGMTLMQAFEERCRAAGARSMHLSVYPENKAARRLYEKAGWMPLLDTITPSDAVHYYKTIGRSE